jgi:hypothetical protein
MNIIDVPNTGPELDGIVGTDMTQSLSAPYCTLDPITCGEEAIDTVSEFYQSSWFGNVTDNRGFYNWNDHVEPPPAFTPVTPNFPSV